MPYVDLDTKLHSVGKDATTAGILTYKLQQEIQAYLLREPVSYERIAAVLGSIEGLKADFIDRVLLPYEKMKREDNGDVWEAILAP